MILFLWFVFVAVGLIVTALMYTGIAFVFGYGTSVLAEKLGFVNANLIGFCVGAFAVFYTQYLLGALS